MRTLKTKTTYLRIGSKAADRFAIASRCPTDATGSLESTAKSPRLGNATSGRERSHSGADGSVRCFQVFGLEDLGACPLVDAAVDAAPAQNCVGDGMPIGYSTSDGGKGYVCASRANDEWMVRVVFIVECVGGSL